MSRRNISFLILFFFPLFSSHSLDVVFTFEPLKPNERLAYQMRDERGSILNLYAQDKETLYITRFLNSWGNSTQWGMLQFANYRRYCFFTVKNEVANVRTLYKLNGNEGIVVRLFDNITIPAFSVSNDGKLILFTGYNDERDRNYSWPEKEGVFSLFNTETGELLHRFYWTVNYARGSFSSFRNQHETFTAIYGGGGDVVYAEARIDPSTLELEIIWDRTDDYEFRPPGRIEGNFFSETATQSHDRTLNLERVIFAPWLEPNDHLPEPIIQATPSDSPEESLINSAAHRQNDKNAVFWITGILGLLFMVCCILAVINRKQKKGNTGGSW